MFALLPLTFDRAVAVMSPLRHSSIITKRACVIMFLAIWLSIVIVLVDNIVKYETGAISIVYFKSYHRCTMSGKSLVIKNIFLFVIPFFVVLLTYAMMFAIIIRKKIEYGQFLIVTTVIIATNLLSYSPTVIVEMTDSIEMSYEVSQVMYATFWYINGVANPLIYVGAHPKTRKYFRSCWQRNNGPDCEIELQERARRNDQIFSAASYDIFSKNGQTDSVKLPNLCKS